MRMHSQQQQQMASSSYATGSTYRADDIAHVLREKVALLPGSRDRENRPVVFIPARDVGVNPDHIRNLLMYLYNVTSDDAKARSFVFVIDMRRGTSWDIVKPILKSLQEYFPAQINCVYIIKPEKFLDKYKISTAKYNKFELQMISLDSLIKHIDFCQIPREFGGSLYFDNDSWVEFRREIESLVHRLSEILKNLDHISIEMGSAELPVDSTAAQASIQKHQNFYPIITSVSIEDFERTIHALREKVLAFGAHQNGLSHFSKASSNQQSQQQHGSHTGFANPDLMTVFPHLLQLLKNVVITRNDVLCQWESRKTELDQCSQLKLFEQDAENLSQWIYQQFNSLTHRFVLIGENDLETSRLLKEHLDFANSVNKIEVSYTQVLTVGKRLLELQSLGMNKIESISQQLKSDWTQFITRIEQRTLLLQLALNAHKKCTTFLKNAEHWQMNVGVDPNSLSSNKDLQEAAKKHQDFHQIYQSTYSEAYEEMSQLMKILKKYFGDSVNQLPVYRIVQDQAQNITNRLKGIHGVWEARDLTIQNKLSSAHFVADLESVLEWLMDHGEPFLHRKVGIGMDPESANVLTQTHQKFRGVAINTHKNAEQIFRMIHVLEDADEFVRKDALKKVEELRQRIDKFRRCTEHRTHLLHLAYYFYLHYEEIMDWYGKMDGRAAYICVVPESLEQCERNKESFQTDNDLTVQAYDRVMIEAQQLLQSLKQQHELLVIENAEAVLHVQLLCKNIENRHLAEKEHWQEQRIYLNTAVKISTFLRDCFEIKKQLESWRQDLQGLRHSVSNTVEIIKQYHTQNTVKVQQVVNDAMKQLSEIMEHIQSKSLHMVSTTDTSTPVEEVIVSAAHQLQTLEQEVMNIAKDISNRIELNIQLGRLRQFAHEIVEAIERQRMQLLRFHQIPGNQQETDSEFDYFNKFRMEIEMFEEKISCFYNEKERFTALPLLALDSHAETRVRAENLLTEVKTKWQYLVGLIDIRNKLLTAANSYYKYTKLLLPTSQSIEKDLSTDRDGDFCRSTNWANLEHCLEVIQDRLDKHSNHKERFLEASVYAQRTAEQFMRFMRRCEAPREHIDRRLADVQHYLDTIRERQAIILRLWTECNAKIEKCKEAVKIKLLARKIVDWSDRELATCVKIIDTAEQFKKSGNTAANQRKKLEDLLEKCLEMRDLIKVERYEVRKMLGEAKRFVDSNPVGDLHAAEVEKISAMAKSKLQNIWNMLSDCEQVVGNALNFGMDGTSSLQSTATTGKTTEQREQLYLDRYSDSTIEDKLAGRADRDGAVSSNGPLRKIMEPMKELLKSESDYIQDLSRCVEIYLYAYKTAGSMCPLALRGKEREIFGNIEELYQFHSSIFLRELLSYEFNPEDVGYCFIAWMEKLKELYADYCLNKEENNYLICLPETISMFSEIRERHNLEPCHDLQSLVIKPVQRITKYHILLKELLKHSTKNTKEIKNAYEIVVSIPKLANDRMHLKSFVNFQDFNVGDFVMQDTFLVSEPKRYFKRERELQIFLFESNIVFTKKEELASKKTGYVYKDSMLLREIHVVEHIEADNTKFGLRRSAFPYQNDQNTTVLKANTEAQRILWVKTLRDLKMDIGRQQKGSMDASSSENQGSRDSQSSLVLNSFMAAQQPSEDGQSVQSADAESLTATGPVVMRGQQQEKQILLVTEPFAATNSDQLSVQSGQKVELLQQQAHSSADQQPQSSAAAATDFVKVALIEAGGTKNTNRPIGLVPRRCLTATQKGGKADTSAGSSSAAQGVASRPSSHHHDCEETASSSGGGNKRTSIRRFFTSSQKAESGSSNKSFLHQNQPSTSSNGNRPTSSSNFRAPESTELAQPHNSVLSPSNTAATTAETSASSSSKLAAVCAVAHNDLVLPPPMDQLVGTSAAGTEVNRVEASTADMAAENQQISTDQPNSSNTNETSNEPISSSDPQLPAAAGTPVEQMSAEDSARLKRSYVLQELVETERAYVQDLTSIVEGYIGTLKEMDLSDEDREKIKIIFANIEQILDFHKTHFCKEIEKSLQDHEAAGNAFIKYERRLHTNYVKYCQNKPKSDFLVSQENFEQLFAEIKEKLGHKVALSDLLIKPVQRITKYQLMLNDVLKYTHRAKDRADVLEKAHAVMRVVPKACDDMMQVGRLQGFQGSLNAQGRLIFQGTLLISDGGTAQPFKGKERRLFLFEQSVLFAECIPPRKEYGNPTYNFKNQIMVNKMVLEEQVPDEPLRFLLQSNDPNQPATYIAQAASAEDKEQWLAKLSAQLDQQKTFLAALVDPKRYQNQLANSVGSMSIGGKKDSSGSLGTPTSPAPGGISPTKQTASAQKSSSKLFGFSKQKS